ncbi:MFS transporter [Paraburkholderia phymatum]|uniref:Major facilitator superfamily MFS_1 n=1 Tax=Paraburkholderia phymatum (strain DSM 17167 / CIP 108236 / LMG 21445 / STM815) TaxID=391038 RepID=B2JVD6_PARP8|nr:MFS transporter [Paraburkholderia phymatum]ACC74913.1 major facilitator superfamily MFS_1 [Paraburkholderia phymatum STM815]
MRPAGAMLLLIGTLLTGAGYGATFLLSMRFRSIGGNEFDTGIALAGGVLGTFAGVTAVRSLAPRIGTARMASLSALGVGIGLAGFSAAIRDSSLEVMAGFLLGLGWGAFYVAAPLALSERTHTANRGTWFLRFGTFQMAGIGGCPALAAYAIHFLHWSVNNALGVIAGLCAIASVLLEIFGRLSPHSPGETKKARWLGDLGAIARTRAVYPILMIALGACVFSGIMTFQMSLVQGTHAQASTFFSLYTLTVVSMRWLLSRLVARVPTETATKMLLVVMVLGIASMFAVPVHVFFQVTAAVLFGTGYGLVYPVMQTQLVNDTEVTHHNAVLTWFVTAYFIGAFGFPTVGGWLLVHSGKGALLTVIAACGVAALLLAFLRDKRRVRALTIKA